MYEYPPFCPKQMVYNLHIKYTYIFDLYILFAITAAGVVPCGGPKTSPRTSSIVQIIFLFRSFEISKDIQSVQNTHV